LDGKVDLGELFFSPRGRTPRGPFLVAAAVLVLVTVFYESAVTAPVHWLTGVLFYPALLFSSVCVLSKRLHDRGRSGWWAAPLLLAVLMVWPHPHSAFDVLAVLMIGWGVVELGLMPGEQGWNRFGSNPRAGAPGPVQA
jgi:uncharacterized membrane protein YhaH (DUF805 family)